MRCSRTNVTREEAAATGRTNVTREEAAALLLRCYSFEELQKMRGLLKHMHDACRYSPMLAVIALLDEALGAVCQELPPGHDWFVWDEDAV